MIISRSLGRTTRILMQHNNRRFLMSAVGIARCSAGNTDISGRYKRLDGSVVLRHQFSSSSSTSSNIFVGEDDQTRRCWKCDTVLSSDATSTLSHEKIAICQKCGSIQPISGDVNLFGLFGLDMKYDIDLSRLRQQYLLLQQNMHPDRNVKRPNTEFSADNSSLINNAYKTLRDPFQRALYLLKHRYLITIDEDNIETEPEMLLEVMELNEDIELATDADSLKDISARLEEEIAEIVAELEKAFATDNPTEARRLVLRFAFYNSSLDKLKDRFAR